MGWRIKIEKQDGKLATYTPQHRYLFFYTSFMGPYDREIAFYDKASAEQFIRDRSRKFRKVHYEKVKV